MTKSDLTRREFLYQSSSTMLAAAAALSIPGCGRNSQTKSDKIAASTTKRKPNIIWIMADDLGYGDIGCYGQKSIKTPNIDRMAAQGIRFTQAYAGSPVCAPTRCSLMTGKHTGHTTIRGNISPAIPLKPDDVTVAEILKSAGYKTACFGKWGLGLENSTGTPTKKGFDEFFGYINQTLAHNYYPEKLWHNDKEVTIDENLNGKKGAYSHDLFAKHAYDYITTHCTKYSSQPFFLYLALTLPHANNELGNATGNGMEVPDYGRYTNQPWADQEKGYAAMITRLDECVGKVIDELKTLGLDDNTIVFFTGDNGAGGIDEGGYDPEFFNSSGPLRGIKRDVYEGGIREPMIARWPGHIKAGTTSDQVWAFWDFLPTAAEIAGAKAPAGIDGISMLPAMLGEPQQNHEYLYWEFPEKGIYSQAVRMGYWKAVRNDVDKPIELYNLKNDLGETKNIANEHPDVVAKMAEIMKTARVDSPVWPMKKAKS
jgi:arylsulfatase A-like enzyme